MEQSIAWFIKNHDSICKTYGLKEIAVTEKGLEVTKGNITKLIKSPKDIPTAFPMAQRIEDHVKNIQPNSLCLCGSGKKYKKCCIYK